MSRSVLRKWQAISRVAADGSTRRKILQLSVLRYNYPGFALLRRLLGRTFPPGVEWTLALQAEGAQKVVSLTMRPGDIGDVSSLFENWIEAPPPLDVIKSPELAVDAGAHIGNYSLMLHSLYPDCRIIAFEPNRENAALLRKNFAQNSIPGEVQQAALWHEDKDSLFMMEGASNAGFASEATTGEEPGYPVAGVSLASALGPDLPRLALLKLDIEGAEYSVLPPLIERLGSNCSIWMELHHVSDHPGWLPQLLEKSTWQATPFDCFPPHEQWLLQAAP